MDLRRGKVIYAKQVRAKDGSMKNRRVIALGSDIGTGVAQCVVTATLRTPEHDTLTEVVISHGKNGQHHPQTTFSQPTVAICDWIVDVPHEEFMPDGHNGHVKPSLFAEINQTVNLLIERQQKQGRESKPEQEPGH